MQTNKHNACKGRQKRRCHRDFAAIACESQLIVVGRFSPLARHPSPSHALHVGLCRRLWAAAATFAPKSQLLLLLPDSKQTFGLGPTCRYGQADEFSSRPLFSGFSDTIMAGKPAEPKILQFFSISRWQTAKRCCRSCLLFL